MNWLRYLLARWEYVGAFEGRVSADDGEAPHKIYYILSQRCGRRRAAEVDGLRGRTSRHSYWAEAEVQKWLAGGPLPKGVASDEEPQFRPKAKLIVFPGGKTS